MEAPHDQASRTREHLTVLVRLARLDRDRDANVRLIENSARVQAARRGELDEAAKRLERARHDLTRARADVDRAELELRSRADQVRKLELQQNTAKSNQEYQALLQQIQRLKTESSAEEDKGLQLYDRIETMTGQVKAEEGRVVEREREFEQFVATYCRDEEAARQELQQTEQRRNALLAELPPDLRATYDRVRSAREGVALAPVEGRTCTGCGMSLTPNAYSRIRGMSSVITCDSCQRILYEPAVLVVPAD